MTQRRIITHVSTDTMGLEQRLPCLQGNTPTGSVFRNAFLENLWQQLQWKFGDTPLELRDAGERKTTVNPGERGDEETAAALGQWLEDWEGTEDPAGWLRAAGAGLTAAARERARAPGWTRTGGREQE